MKHHRDLHHSMFIKYYVCQALIINSVIHDPASTYIIYILNELFFQLNKFFHIYKKVSSVHPAKFDILCFIYFLILSLRIN